MDIKSKNTNDENNRFENQEVDINELKKTKINISVFKNIKIKANIVYILITILLSMVILSVLEVKDNLRFIVPDKIYTETQVSDNIFEYTDLASSYAMYYKSDKYSNEEKNITQNDIDICKAELRDKSDQEFNEFRDFKYNDSSFNNLTYEQQEKILSDKRKEIDEKYNLSDKALIDYVLQRKSRSETELSNKIEAYTNLKFAAYDKISETWIGGNKKELTEIRSNSRYFNEINIDYNGNIIEKIFINGKELNRNSFLNRFIDKYSKYNYYNTYRNSVYESITLSETKYEYGYSNGDNHNITLYIWMPRELQAGDVVYESFTQVNENVKSLYISIILLFIYLILLIGCILYLAKKKERVEGIQKIIEKIKLYPIEYKIAAAIVGFIFWESGINNYYGINSYIKRVNLTSIIWCSVVIVIYYILIRVIVINYNEGTLFKNNITVKVWDYLSDVMNRGSIIKAFLIITALYIISGLALLFLSAALYVWPIGIIAGIIITIIYIVIIINNIVYLDKIMVGAKAATEGRLTYKIDEKGRGHLRELAHDINNIKEGLKKSVENEMKSESMKTELITNVSHDLKTPLTSIINYIDLLKREEIEPESARDYINVLDKKSQRLKVLIEDLFEASKAASGAMELNITKIDIGQLLKQAIGENDERFREKNLEVKLNTPEEKMFINGDGKRLYRVFENLISNAVKYSLGNTRVYIDMYKKEDEVIIIMKNISAYELNFDENEITNRFKRGDASRTTEGSGLGLAISKSIIELHGGKFSIEVDGDLFKSIIVLK